MSSRSRVPCPKFASSDGVSPRSCRTGLRTRNSPTTASEAIDQTAGALKKVGIPDAQAEAEFLLAGILGRNRAALRLEGDEVLTRMQLQRWASLLKRRLSRVPLAYLLGRQPFLDMILKVKPGIFIPRPETEELVEAVLKTVGCQGSGVGGREPRHRGLGDCGLDNGRPRAVTRHPSPITQAGTPALRILDLCTGSGAIAIALARRIPGARLTAVDTSAQALVVARENARQQGVSRRTRFLAGDLYVPLKGLGLFDIIVSNPPYVPSENLSGLQPEVLREPVDALDGGPGGTRFLERIITSAPGYLRLGGWLLLEMDSGQACRLSTLMRRAGFGSVEALKDLQGLDRILTGRWPGKAVKL